MIDWDQVWTKGFMVNNINMFVWNIVKIMYDSHCDF